MNYEKEKQAIKDRHAAELAAFKANYNKPAPVAGHTPGPWKWESNDTDTNLYGPNPKDKYDYILSIYESVGGGGFPPDEANAAFIVRACNSHYELLEIIQAIFTDINNGAIDVKNGIVIDSVRHNQMATVIAKATGGDS